MIVEVIQTLAVLAVLGFIYWISSGKSDFQTYLSTLKPEVYRNKVVWITGASSGIGESLAYAFARLDVDVKLILSARRVKQLNKVKDGISECYGHDKNCLVLPLDLLDAASFPEAVSKAYERFGKVDVLINNAGVDHRSFLTETDEKCMDMVINVNLYSPIELTRVYLNRVLEEKQSYSQIINISSVQGKLCCPKKTVYCASKFGLIGFGKALEQEMELCRSMKEFSVIHVCPGYVESESANKMLVGKGNNQIQHEDKHIKSEGSLGRMTALDCSNLVLKGASNGVREIWTAQGLPLVTLYLSQYFPQLMSFIMWSYGTKMVMKQYNKRDNIVDPRSLY